MKRLFIILVLCILSGLTKAMGAEAYAVFDGSSKLTFYYDNSRNSRGTTFTLNNTGSSPGWSSKSTSITTVVFDPSFAGARPTCTDSWFSDMRNLTTITGMEYLNTSEVTSMAHMFGFCITLPTVALQAERI